MTREEELEKMVDENMQPDGSIELYPIFVYLYGKKDADAVADVISGKKLMQGESIEMCVARILWDSLDTGHPFEEFAKDIIRAHDKHHITYKQAIAAIQKLAEEQKDENLKIPGGQFA